MFSLILSVKAITFSIVDVWLHGTVLMCGHKYLEIETLDKIKQSLESVEERKEQNICCRTLKGTVFL